MPIASAIKPKLAVFKASMIFSIPMKWNITIKIRKLTMMKIADFLSIIKVNRLLVK